VIASRARAVPRVPEAVMREIELKRLIMEEFLASIEDPRVERTRKHSLETIVVLSLLAVISGADDFVSIERYGIAKREWLASFLDLSAGVPSHDTIGRVFAALNTDALTAAFARWTAAMATSSADKLIAIDGKVLRRSFKHAGDHAFVRMVSAWSSTNGVVLGQVKAEDDSNETAAIPALLDLIEVNSALVSIDAAGTQTEIAEKIVSKGGDYLLALKANQPTLHAEVIDHFERHGAGVLSLDSAETVEDGHGRHERRRAWVSHAVADIASARRWPKLATLVRIESTRAIGLQQSRESRYYICSRRNLTAKQALHAVRAHWAIENNLHWVLDVAFREDDSRVRAANAAANFAAVRRLALNLLKQRTETKVGIKNRRLCAGWDHAFMLRTIGLNA
jgi:predicted transposase YbfD/YdcC